MNTDNRKVVLIGTGMVGMSYAYALLNQNACDELVLIDLDKERARGEAMDLNHGLAFSSSHMRIYAGEYKDCENADIVVICAGVAQKPGESRLDLLTRNTEVFRSIIGPITESGFNGIFLVATNPVDIMTLITAKLSGFNPRRVLGTGTALDTARLRYMLGEYFNVDPRNMHAYVIGEHGDSEFVAWSQAMLATKPILDLLRRDGGLPHRRYEGSLKSRSALPPSRSSRRNGPPITASVWLWFASQKPFSAMKTASSPSPPCCGENMGKAASMRAFPVSSTATASSGCSPFPSLKRRLPNSMHPARRSTKRTTN